MNEDSRKLRDAWKQAQRRQVQSTLPLASVELKALFDDVAEKVQSLGCDHSHRFTLAHLTAAGHETELVLKWLRETGGYCDCEVAVNSRQVWEEAVRPRGRRRSP